MSQTAECLKLITDQTEERPDPKIYGDDPVKALRLKNQDDYLKIIWEKLRNNQKCDCHSC